MKVSIIAHPNVKKPRVEKDMFGTIHVYVQEPPIDGRANKAVVKTLAKYFNTKKRCIFLLSGLKSKNKIFEIRNN